MDVRFSPEQEALRDSVVQVVDHLGPKTVGQLDDAERTAKLDAAVAGAGWRELRMGDEGGRPWASGVEAAIVAEELSRGLADVPFLGPTLAAELIRLGGSDASSEGAEGAGTVALTPDLSALAQAGAAAVAVDAAGATRALVLDGGRLGTVGLPPIDPSLAVDLTRPSAVVPSGTATGAASGSALTEDELTRWTALGLAVTSAELVGAMRGAIDLATEYARQRQQYGAPIGSFQAVQHLLADAFTAMKGSRSTALHAAWAVDALEPAEALVAAAAAKAYCSRAALSVCETAIQVHGGIGNTWECLAHVQLRRALLSTDVLGGVGPNLARVLAHNGIGATDGLR
jgi:alkylation response protein AidB-like acyl-CoA dehydrogenase